MCPSNTLWHLLTEGFALAPSSWKAPLPHLTPHSALAPACSSFPLCEWMPLSLEACLPFHQAKPLHLNAALSVHSPWHICQSALLMSSLTSSPELPEGSIFMSVCLSVCLVHHAFPGTEPGAQRVLSKGSADPLWADSTVILLPTQPLPLVTISTRWWQAPGSGEIKCSSGSTMSYSVTLGHLLPSCRPQ